jgi:hypothetical protein
MKKILVSLITLLTVNYLLAQPIDYDHLEKEYRDLAIQALASIKPGTKKWVEETALKHPAGNFDTSWVKGQVLSVFGMEGSDLSELLSIMVAYQKMLNKEAREDSKIKNINKEQTLQNKESKLVLDNYKTDQQRQEANEKYNNMTTANNKFLIKSDSLKQKPDTIRKPQPPKINSAGKRVSGDADSDHRRVSQDIIKKLQDQIAELKKNGNF